MPCSSYYNKFQAALTNQYIHRYPQYNTNTTPALSKEFEVISTDKNPCRFPHQMSEGSGPL